MGKINQGQEQFAGLMASRGCLLSGAAYCGAYNGLPYAAYFTAQSAKATTFQLNIRFEQKPSGKFFKAVKSALQENGIKTNKVLIQGNLISLQFVVPGAELQNAQVDLVLQTIQRAGLETGAALPSSCAVCKNGNVDSYVLENGYYTTVHANCVQQRLSKSVAKVEDNEQNGNYLLGIIGAILGGIIGTLPNVLSIAFAETIYALLCALVPLGAYFGYKLFRGKMNKAAMISTILVSLLMIPVMDFLTETINFYQAFDELLPIGLYISTFIEYPGDFIPAYLQMLLFVGIGFLFVLGIISNGNKGIKQGATATANTLRPIRQQGANSEDVYASANDAYNQ